MIDSSDLSAATASTAAAPQLQSLQHLTRQMTEASVRTMHESLERSHAVHAASLRVNESMTNFRMILQARIEGVKAVSDLTRSAIQKSGAN